MEQEKSQIALIGQLQQNILLWQGFVPPACTPTTQIGLGMLEKAFPNQVFPTGAIHEMLCSTTEQAAATSGFLSGILAALMQQGGACLWISTNRKLFPLAMSNFNVPPERIIFIDVQREKEALWAMEEALKCEGLAAVVAEIREITFAQSRRLQLTVESSKVTGFLLRTDLTKLTTTVCVARWQVSSLPSVLEDDLPGVGHPKWQVDLLRVKNGMPGSWKFEWTNKGFVPAEDLTIEHDVIETRQVG